MNYLFLSTEKGYEGMIYSTEGDEEECFLRAHRFLGSFTVIEIDGNTITELDAKEKN